MVKNRAASAGIAPSPPRPMDSVVTEINDLMKKAEWTIDAYDTRNERPTGDQHTGDPGTSLNMYEIQLANLLLEGAPWIGNATIEADSARVHYIRADDGTEIEVVNVAVQKIDNRKDPHQSLDYHRIPAEMAALLNWQETMETLRAGLVKADQAGKWVDAVAFAEAIVQVCTQFREEPKATRHPWIAAEPTKWPEAGRLTKATPDVARVLTATVNAVRKHFESQVQDSAATS